MATVTYILGQRRGLLGLVLASLALIGVGCWLDRELDEGASLGGAR